MIVQRWTVVAPALSLLYAGSCLAAVPELHVKRTITIAAPADKVWDVAKNFDGLAAWLPGVASADIISGANNSAGAVRLVTLKGGGTVKEKLLAFDETGHRFRYAILESQLPVDHYSGTFGVISKGRRSTLVTWSARFKRKNTIDNPPDSEKDKAAADSVTAVYKSGLDNLKEIVESK